MKNDYKCAGNGFIVIFSLTVLGNLPVPGRPINFDESRARTFCACSRCGCVFVFVFFFDIFFLSSIFSLFFPLLQETDGYRLKYCLKGLLTPPPPPKKKKTQHSLSCFVFLLVYMSLKVILCMQASGLL